MDLINNPWFVLVLGMGTVDRYAFDAAVAAAIAAYTGRDIKGFRITRITKM